MGNILVQSPVSGKIRDYDTVKAVNHVFDVVNSRPIWEGIDKIITQWHDKFPEEYKEIEYRNSVTRSQLADKRGGRSADTGFIRYKLEIPERVAIAIETFYGHKIKRFAGGWKGFDEELGERYPIFRIAAKS